MDPFWTQQVLYQQIENIASDNFCVDQNVKLIAFFVILIAPVTIAAITITIAYLLPRK